MTSEPRQWSMFGMRHRNVWVAVGAEPFVRMHGCASPEPVTVTEDSEGEYAGWIPTGDSDPIMILKAGIFNIQFPYGWKAEEDHGKGSRVLLRIAEVTDVQ